MANINKNLGRTIKQQRVMSGLTLQELTRASGVSSSHLGRIERGERFPSARILGKIAKPLGFSEQELFTFAGYLPSQVETEAEVRRLDPYVANVLSQEPVEVQRTVIAILSIFKSIAKGGGCDTGFAEYVHRKHPEVDEVTTTMTEDMPEHPPGVSCEFCGMPADKVLVLVVDGELEASELGFKYQYEVRCRNPLCRSVYAIFE